MRSLAEVPEAGAPARVAELYADIRVCLGTSFVNLVYRHLATDPGSLEWAWRTIRPHLRSGELAAQASKMRCAVAAECATWPPACPQLARPGGADAIGRLIAEYNTANATNLIALTHLFAPAQGSGPTGAHASNSGTTAAMEDPRVGTGTRSGAPRAAAREDALPPLPAFDSLSDEVRGRINQLNAYAEEGPPAIVASLFRHLAAWNGALEFAHDILEPLERQGLLAAGREATVRAAHELANTHPLAVAPAPHGFAQRFGPTLGTLRTVTISKMLPIGYMLAQALRPPDR